MDIQSGLLRLCARLRRGGDREEVLSAARRIFGLDDLVYMHADAAGAPDAPPRVLRAGGSFPDRWPHPSSALFRRLLRLGRSRVLPVDLANLDAESLADAADGRPSRGLLVPLHGPAGQFAVLLALHAGDASGWKRWLEGNLATFHLFSVHLFEAMNEILAEDRRNELEPLTRREIECLYWCAEGKSYWETSIILGISERTVNHHMKMVRRKLGVQTNAQAVGRAALMGLLLDCGEAGDDVTVR